MTYKVFLKEMLSQARQKTNKVSVKKLFSETHLCVNISKLSTKMFIKRKIKAGKPMLSECF